MGEVIEFWVRMLVEGVHILVEEVHMRGEDAIAEVDI